MRYLLDSNIVLRLANESTAEHDAIRQALRGLVARGDELLIVPQTVYEFWNVCTRPVTVNGFGWDIRRTRMEVERLLLRFPLLPETPEVFSLWLNLVTAHKVRGKQVHDTRLAAAAQAHGVDHLLTLNVPDFGRFGISSLHPDDVLS